MHWNYTETEWDVTGRHLYETGCTGMALRYSGTCRVNIGKYWEYMLRWHSANTGMPQHSVRALRWHWAVLGCAGRAQDRGEANTGVAGQSCRALGAWRSLCVSPWSICPHHLSVPIPSPHVSLHHVPCPCVHPNISLDMGLSLSHRPCHHPRRVCVCPQSSSTGHLWKGWNGMGIGMMRWS